MKKILAVYTQGTGLKVGTRQLTESQASCSCCGLYPHEDWIVVRASLVDSDGEYYSYLCYNLDENCGCLPELLKEQAELDDTAKKRQLAADITAELLGDDEDGVWSIMQDSPESYL